MSKPYLYLFSILLMFFTACKTDRFGHNLPDDAPAEEIYFADYIASVDKWGFIDTAGKIVIEAVFDDVRDFRNGLAAANLKGKWGFIDPFGKKVIDFKYRSVNDFSEGLAIVQDMDKNIFYINDKGNKMLECPFDECLDFKGLYAKMVIDDRVGLRDRSGNIKVKPMFEEILYDELYYITISFNGHYEIFLAENDKSIFRNSTGQIWLPSCGKIKIQNGDACYYIDLKNTNTKSKLFDDGSDYYYDYALVNKNDDFFLMDKYFVTIKTNCISMDYGGESYWLCQKINDKFTILNNQGRELRQINQTGYNVIMRYSDGFAAVEKDGLWGYIDTSGVEKIAPSWPIVWDFKGGKSRAISQTGIGFIDKKNNWVIPPNFLDLRDFSENRARFQVFENK